MENFHFSRFGSGRNNGSCWITFQQPQIDCKAKWPAQNSVGKLNGSCPYIRFQVCIVKSLNMLRVQIVQFYLAKLGAMWSRTICSYWSQVLARSDDLIVMSHSERKSCRSLCAPSKLRPASIFSWKVVLSWFTLFFTIFSSPFSSGIKKSSVVQVEDAFEIHFIIMIRGVLWNRRVFGFPRCRDLIDPTERDSPNAFWKKVKIIELEFG